jgi:cell wall-associated NlpC family hydrolase
MKTINNVNPNGLSASEFRQYKVVCAALWGYYNANDISYSHIRGRGLLDQCKPPPYIPDTLDCSAFALYCYKIAGAPSPSSSGYDGQVSTASLWPVGKLVGTSSYKMANLEPGDLVFYASGTPHGGDGEHVSVYISDGMVISHGSPRHGPVAVTIEKESGYTAGLYGIRRYPFGS